MWSAGCSSGEEPYTLAMLVADYLDQAGRGGAAAAGSTIDATDIDRASLERARDGASTGGRALTEMPSELVERYFEDGGDDAAASVERVRRRVARAAASI